MMRSVGAVGSAGVSLGSLAAVAALGWPAVAVVVGFAAAGIGVVVWIVADTPRTLRVALLIRAVQSDVKRGAK